MGGGVPLGFIGKVPIHTICGIHGTQAAVALQFGALEIEAVSKPLFVLATSPFQGALVVGKSAATVLDGADAALDGSACVFGPQARTALPSIGTSTAVLAADAWEFAGATTNSQLLHWPVYLYIAVGEFFFVANKTVDDIAEASVMWAEVEAV